MKIGILSDTHGTFDEKVQLFLKDVDQLWHAGDIGSLELADTIAAFKPLRAVYGNIDDHRVRSAYPRFQHFTNGEVSVLMTHIGNDEMAKAYLKKLKPTIYVTGHSHILKVINKDDTLCINPGAAGFGYQGIRTAVRLEIDGARIHSLEIIEL